MTSSTFFFFFKLEIIFNWRLSETFCLRRVSLFKHYFKCSFYEFTENLSSNAELLVSLRQKPLNVISSTHLTNISKQGLGIEDCVHIQYHTKSFATKVL